jgi:hypothetical protein
MKLTHNAEQVALHHRRAAQALLPEVRAELRRLAAQIAADMRQRAPKHRSTLTNSIRAAEEAPTTWTVRPNVEYARWVEAGRKPGKGLPRFFDPAAAQIVAWLDARLEGARAAGNPKYRRGRLGSARRSAAELELRDRYMALSRAVRARGIKPAPFVAPTADAWRTQVPKRLQEAVQRALAKGKP